MNRNRVVVSGVAVSILLLALGGLAWACTPSRLLVLSPTFAEGPLPRPVTVTGNGFVPGVPVEIRWNTVKGPELGRAEAADFSASIQIPSAAKPDAYYIVAVQRDPSGAVLSKATAVFDVKAESPGPQGRPGSERLGDLWSGFSPHAGSGPGSSAVNSLDMPSTAGPSSAIAEGLLAAGLAGVVTALLVPVARKRQLRKQSRN